MNWSWLAQENSPVFVYDARIARANAETVRRAVTGPCKLLYSVKANPNPYLIAALAPAVDGFDVSSTGELDLLLRLKIDPSRITLSGPAHGPELLRKAFAIGLRAIHLDCAEELGWVPSERASATRLTLRLNLGGGSSPKLGFTPDHVEALASRLPSGFFSGVHFYGGRESFTRDGFGEHVREALALRSRFPRIFGADFELFVGPGIPSLTVAEISDGQLAVPGHPLTIEAGRAIAASAGHYAAPVAAVKENTSGRRTVLVRGGTQHLGGSLVSPVYGTRGIGVDFYRNGGVFSTERVASSVFGSLCLSNDAIHPDASLPADLARGDWLIFHPCGAYGLTASANQFIAQELPREFLIENGQRLDASAQFKTYHESFSL